MIVRLASDKDSEHIYKIWHTCFSDDQVYITNYLKYCLPHTKTWILGLNENEFVSCLSVLPSFVLKNDKEIRGGYLYAVGTLPEHRGNSYSKTLMNEAIQASKNDGLSYMLVKPASDSLYNFYINSSFNRVLSGSVSVFQTKEPFSPRLNITISALNAPDLFALRKEFFADKQYLWPEDILQYVIIEAQSRFGFCVKAIIEDENCNRALYFIAYPDDNCSSRIKVLETNARSPFEIECLISILKTQYPEMEETEIESPVDFIESVSYTVNRNALLLSFDEKSTSILDNLHLSLPME